VKIDDLASILDMNRTEFFKKLGDWSKIFNFTIDGDFIEILAQDIDAFMNLLDKSYDEWAESKSQKHKKLVHLNLIYFLK
jgi:hypothetical protein